MIVVLDTSILLPLLEPGVSVPPPPRGISAGSAVGRIEHLVADLDARGAAALIPTPVLSELLTWTDVTAADVLSRLSALRVFRIVPFDERAAIECAMLLSDRRRSGSKGAGGTRAKVKFDHQIAATAKVRGATRIYSDDDDLKQLGKKVGIEVVGFWDLPARPEDAEPPLPFGDW